MFATARACVRHPGPAELAGWHRDPWCSSSPPSSSMTTTVTRARQLGSSPVSWLVVLLVRHRTPHPATSRGAHRSATLQRYPHRGEQPMTPRPGWLGVMVHRWDRGRTLPARSRALFVAAVLCSLVGVRSLECRSTCSAIANGIDEGHQADDPDGGKDDETLSGPRRPPDSAVLRNVFNHRHHDVADNNYSRQDRRDGQTEGHTERPTGPPVTAIREHVRDRNPHQTAIVSGRPDQTSPRLSRSRVPTKPSGQPRQVQPAAKPRAQQRRPRRHGSPLLCSNDIASSAKRSAVARTCS